MIATNPSLGLDHVTVAGSNLDALCASLRQHGLEPVYGGAHSNGVTHMAVVPGDDDTYIELISTLQPGAASPLWASHVAEDGGLCAWAVRTERIEEEVRQLRDAGVTVTGPVPLDRRRPDGQVARWQLAFVGEGPPGATLPFLIEDITPIRLRTRPPAPSEETAERATVSRRLVGVAGVVLGVADLEEAVRQLRRVYGLPAPHLGRVAIGELPPVPVAHFRETPVTLAAAERELLRERMQRFGPCPIACLLRVSSRGVDEDPRGAMEWFGERVEWVRTGPSWLGLLPPQSSSSSPSSSSSSPASAGNR